MTHTKDWVAVLLVTLFVSFLAGCATPPAKEEIGALDYGECPRNHEAKIKKEFESGLLLAYSGDPIIWPPQKYWYQSSPFEGSQLYVGYLVPVMAEQTRGPTPTGGKQLYGFLFKDDQLVKKLHPMQMSSLRTREAVGPIPKDERDWKEGYSTGKGAQLLVEYVVPGETVQNWSELISVQIVRNVHNMTPEQLVAGAAELAKKKKPGCAVVSQEILASTPTELLYGQTLANCAPIRDEYSIRKTIRGPRSMTEVSYSKTTALTDAEKKKWAEIVGRTKLLDECQPKL